MIKQRSRKNIYILYIIYKINFAKFILIVDYLHGRLKSNYMYLILT